MKDLASFFFESKKETIKVSLMFSVHPESRFTSFSI